MIIVIVAEREERDDERGKRARERMKRKREERTREREKERREEKREEKAENPSVCRFKTPPCVRSGRLRVYPENARMC